VVTHENQSIFIDQAAVFYLDEGLLTFDMILRLIKKDFSAWLAKRKSSSSPDPTVRENHLCP